MYKKNLLKRKNLIATFVTVLLVTISLISSSSISAMLNKISNTKNSNLEAIEKEILTKVEPSTGIAPSPRLSNPSTGIAPSIINLESKSIRDNMPQLPEYPTIYGYNILTSPHGKGPCKFDVENPGDIIQISNEVTPNFASGGVWTPDERWIVCEYSDGALYQIDVETGEITEIGGGGVGLNGLAYNFHTNTIYGASGSNLYWIDTDTGEQELIGSFGSGVNQMIAIAFDIYGVLYGWDLGDKLWTIDIDTGQATLVGPLGIDINYAQDGAFDKENGILYLTAFTLSPQYGGFLYECDEETGECTLVGPLEGSAEIDASMIQWCWCDDHDVGVKDIISPVDGDASEDMEVSIRVQNYVYDTEEDVPINVVILKDGINEEYNETVYVDIEGGEIVDVEMPVWTTDDWHSAYNEYIDYKITAHIKLYGDEYPENNYKEKWFELYFGYFHDVGSTNVIGPKSGPAQKFNVNATIKNLGQYDECCFKTYVEIAELDTDNQIELLTENFSDPTFPPNEWTKTHSNWMRSNSNYSGGSSGEAIFLYSPKSTDYFRLYTLAIDTSDYGAIAIEFKHYVYHKTTPYSLQIETSDDGINWDVVWDINPTSYIGPETITILTAKNVGSTTYVSWTFNGNSSNIYYWYIDDIVINGYTSFNPEYEDYHCTTLIEPGKENELEFDDWTPDYLQYETTGTKKYIVKAWTDMNNPSDENLDNDLFVKSIVLDYFHDVSIRVSAPINETKIYLIWDNGDTDGTNRYILSGNPQRRLLDDFELTQTAKISEIQLLLICPYGNPNDFEVRFRQDVNKKPSTTIYATSKDIKTTSKATGRTWFGYPEQLVTYDFQPIKLSKGIWWAEFWTSASAGNMFMMVRAKLWREECWINYPGYFMKGSSYYGIKADLSYQLWGQAGAEVYVPIGPQDINGLASNNGTFPERDMTCYAEIYEYYTDCSEGTLVYEDNITDIDILTPLTGTKTLIFDDYNFDIEGLYILDLNLADNNDDHLDNNQLEYMIGCDATPPATTHVLNPPAPDGLNSWYISDVEITLTAADPSIGCDIDGSGIKEIKYHIDDGAVQTLPGDTGTFTVSTDSTMHTIKYWAIDNVGNTESQKTIQFKQDQTPPEMELTYEWNGNKPPYLFTFTTNAVDATSGMQRVEIYLNSELQETIVGPGPYYIWQIKWVPPPHAIFKAIAYDFAGVNAYDEIRDPQRNKNSILQSISTSIQSINIWLLRWLDRFPFFQRILTLRGWIIL